MSPRPLILIAGWGHTGKAMLRLKEALDGSAVIGQLQGGVDAVRQNRGLPFSRTAATTEALSSIRFCRIPPVTEGLRYDVQVTSTGELWQTRSSAALPRSSGLSQYAAGLRDLLVTFGGHAGVIGWSMGGIVALETARNDPGLLQRLVLISGTARFSAGNDEPLGVSASVLRAMASGLRQTPDKVLTAYYDQVHAPQGMPAAETATRTRDIARLDRGELLQGLDYLQRTDVRNGLDQITVPTLVVHGREDRIVPWQAGEWLSRRLAASHWRCYEGLGHALPIQAAALLAADIRAFLGDAS